MFCVLLQKNETFSRSFAKERNILALFPVLYKRTRRFLHSFTFFAKEWENLYVLFRSFEKNGMFRSFGSQKSPKTQKKEWERTEQSERERTRGQTLRFWSLFT